MQNFIQEIVCFLRKVKAKDNKEVRDFFRWTKSKIRIDQRNNPRRKLVKGLICSVCLGKNIGSEFNKTRPCIVFRGNKFVNDRNLLIIPLTSLKTNNTIRKTDLLIRPKTGNNLEKTSIARTSNLRDVSLKRIGHIIGKLDKNEIEKIENKLKKYLDIK